MLYYAVALLLTAVAIDLAVADTSVFADNYHHHTISDIVTV